MPLTNSQYNALMRVYEEKRAKSRDLANLHYERACQKVPELASIDASISSASLDQAKKLLAGDDTALASLKGFSNRKILNILILIIIHPIIETGFPVRIPANLQRGLIRNV